MFLQCRFGKGSGGKAKGDTEIGHALQRQGTRFEELSVPADSAIVRSEEFVRSDTYGDSVGDSVEGKISKSVFVFLLTDV